MSDSIDNREESAGSLTYEDLVATIEIDKILVKRLNMEGFIQPHRVPEYLDGDRQISLEITHEFKLESHDEAESIIAIGLIQAKASIEEDIVFLIDVEILAEYDASEMDKPLTEEILLRFLQHNVPVNVWPYAREIIHTGTTRMGYPPLVIKPYRVFA